MERDSKGKLELIASKAFKPDNEMYKIVDYLNKNLKQQNLMFGLTKTEDGLMTITIYKT